MKKTTIAAAILTLAACAGTTTGPLDQIVGKLLVSEDGRFIANADGTMSGEFGGEALAGVWRNENGQFCRSGTLGTTQNPDACQIIAIAGDTVTLTHVSGSQSTTTYRFAQ